jgi:hypothetical protein
VKAHHEQIVEAVQVGVNEDWLPHSGSGSVLKKFLYCSQLEERGASGFLALAENRISQKLFGFSVLDNLQRLGSSPHSV